MDPQSIATALPLRPEAFISAVLASPSGMLEMKIAISIAELMLALATTDSPSATDSGIPSMSAPTASEVPAECSWVEVCCFLWRLSTAKQAGDWRRSTGPLRRQTRQG